MSAAAERAPQSAVAGEAPETSAQAEARTPAREASVPTALPAALPLTPVTPPDGDTESPIPAQAREALGRLLAAFAIPKGTNVLHSCGLHAAHVRHREAAAHWDAAAVRWLRRAWGWVHLLLKACLLEPLDWVTESPARTIAAVIVYLLVTHWLQEATVMNLTLAGIGAALLAAWAICRILRCFATLRAIAAFTGICLVTAGASGALGYDLLIHLVVWVENLLSDFTNWLFHVRAGAVVLVIMLIGFVVYNLHPKNKAHRHTDLAAIALAFVLLAGVAQIPALNGIPSGVRHGVGNAQTAVNGG